MINLVSDDIILKTQLWFALYKNITQAWKMFLLNLSTCKYVYMYPGTSWSKKLETQ